MRRAALFLAALSAISCGGGGGGGSSPTSPGGTVDQTVAHVSITGNLTTVVAGQSIVLGALATNSGGTSVPASITWSSNNTAVATVGSSSGVVTGVTVGNATITAAAGSVTGTRVISVTNASGGGAPPPLVAEIDMPGTTFEPNNVTVGVGGVVNFVFTAVVHNVFFSGPGAPSTISDTHDTTVQRTFNTAGTINITCTIHPGMNGVITVR